MNRRVAVITILSSSAMVLVGVPVALAQTDHRKGWPTPTPRPTERPYCTLTPIPPTATKVPATPTTRPELPTVFPWPIWPLPTVPATSTAVATRVPTSSVASHPSAPSQAMAPPTATSTAVPTAVAAVTVVPRVILPVHLPRAGDVSAQMVAGIGLALAAFGIGLRWLAAER